MVELVDTLTKTVEVQAARIAELEEKLTRCAGSGEITESQNLLISHVYLLPPRSRESFVTLSVW